MEIEKLRQIALMLRDLSFEMQSKINSKDELDTEDVKYAFKEIMVLINQLKSNDKIQTPKRKF